MGRYKLWLAKLLTILGLFIAVPVLIGGLADGASSKHKVAVISLEGVITDSTDTLAALYKQANDEDVKAIVLRVDSPGGAVAPSQEIYEAVRKLKDKNP